MRRVAEILRLKYEAGLTNRQIARSCGIGRATVADYLDRAQRAELSWPLPEDLDDDQIQERLFPEGAESRPPARPLPDMDYVHKQLRRPHVTLQLVWEEYRTVHPDGYAYTQFCEYYKRWRAPLEVTLRQTHTAGDKTFLDWAGDALHWIDPDTGERCPAYLFVAVLGASNYTFTQAYPDQQLPRWIEAHVDACEYFGGVTRLWVPEYVPGHIFGAMWPGRICGVVGCHQRDGQGRWTHNDLLRTLATSSHPFQIGGCHAGAILRPSRHRRPDSGLLAR
jgi:hypothetical protein